jgi:hypothetical protein
MADKVQIGSKVPCRRLADVVDRAPDRLNWAECGGSPVAYVRPLSGREAAVRTKPMRGEVELFVS